MKKKLSIIILLAVITGMLVACGSAPQEEVMVETPRVIIAEGRLLPVSVLDLSFTVSGQVDEVLVTDGESVRKDQVLARLVDSVQAQSALASAQQDALAAQQALDDYKAAAQVNLAQAQIEAILAGKRRTTALNNYNASKSRESTARLDESEGNLAIAEAALKRIEENDGLDPEQLNTLEARLNAAEAAVASAQAAIDALELKAPMAGTVADVRIIHGQRVQPGEVVMAVADFGEWVVETDNLTETEVVALSVGQSVDVVLDALPDVALQGEVVRINQRFEEKRGDITYTVTVVLKETDPLMRWGMTAAVRFEKIAQ
jgi:multidrug resistance efflux pump